jgi:Family of unknown function (DUF6441)
MKFVAQVKGNIADYMRVEAESGARAASRVMGEETRNLQLGLRAQVNSAFGPKGRGIGNAWRARTFPRRPSLGAAGLVWSKVPAIVDAFEKGAMIRPKGGKKFLAIPTGFNAAQGRRGRGAKGMRVTPAQMVASKQAFMRPFKSGRGFVWCLPLKAGEQTGKRRRTKLIAGGVAEVGTGNRKGREAWARGLLAKGMVPMFILLPAVKLPKKLDIAQPARAAAARIPSRFVAEWDKEVRANVRA